MESNSVVEEIIATRDVLYGGFGNVAELDQDLKECIYGWNNWQHMEPYKKLAIEMILHKISRIVVGDSNYLDSWIDIQGYARLVSDRLVETEAQTARRIYEEKLIRREMLMSDGSTC